ncbi:hypothetical protein F5Y08DRAFT_328246 [Xylaria arbuscula]|nr:hypothetical protein F5Y08DRAFT_328246 [Xylaria arbuscula]
MSGFEVVGIVLGAIPLLISALEHYERGVKTIQVFRRNAKVMHTLATALSTEQTILRNTCETLLSGIIDPRDMKPLLADPFGPMWQDPDTQALIERRLDHTMKDFRVLIYSMRQAVEEMRVKLGLESNLQIKVNTEPISKREMIKIALQFSTHETSLNRIADINQKLDLMIVGNLRNEPYLSRSIFNTLRTSLSCSCASSHSVGFGLPTPKVIGQADDEETLDTKGKAHRTWVWDEFVLRLAKIPMNVCAATPLPTSINVAKKNSRLKRVNFLDNSTTELLMQRLSLISGKSKASQGVASSSQVVTQPFSHDRSPPLIQVKDICRTLSSNRPDIKDQGPYGYLLDETTQVEQRFELYPFKSSFDSDECTMVYLTGVFSQRVRPSLAQKYHIAATAATGILFMHNTSWMPTALTINDVFLVSRHGDVDFGKIYLAKRSLHSFGASASTSTHGVSQGVTGGSALYYLAVFLMEIIMWKPVYHFWDEEDFDVTNVPFEDIFDYTTAKGFARIEGILKRIEWIGSPEFREVVENCIKCNSSALSLDDDTFRQGVYNDIVLPLQDADRLVGGKMTVGKER